VLRLINEVLYGVHGVEPCVSEPRSTRPGVSYARLHETIEDGKSLLSTQMFTCVSEPRSTRPGVSYARLHETIEDGKSWPLRCWFLF